MKALLTTLALLVSIFHASAQKEIPPFNGHHKNIFVEFLGSHGLMGANFDMRLKKGRMDGIGFRAGIGGVYFQGEDENSSASLGLVTFPIEFNHLVGKRRSSFVSGVGILPVYAALNASGEVVDNQYVSVEGFGIGGGFLTLGYRLQPRGTGFMLQFVWNPLILRGSGFRAGWVGLGMGIGFK